MPAECAVCRRPATQTCEGCRASDYCCWEHQTADWESHIAHCRPFKVDRNDYLGRHFVATRPVVPGEVVLKERPLVAGPSRCAAAVCPGCLRRLPGEGLTACARCGWPACSEACARSERHLPECELAAQVRPQVRIITSLQLKREDLKSSHPLYRCLTVLRCLQQKKMDQKKWQILMRLEPHSERRMKSGMYESDRVEIVNCLTEFFDLSKDFTEEEMLKVCGIVEINGYVSHLTDPPHITIYDTASFIEHSCLANCSKTFAPDGELLLRAAVAVPAGEHLSICYTDQTWGTARRRYHLAAEQLACRCERCLDPCELGTFYSAVACQRSDCSGYLLPEDPLTDANTTDEDYCYSGNTSWRCAECGAAMRASDITLFLRQAERDVRAVTCPEECETLLALFDGKVLHRNHYYLTELRIKLVVTYGRDRDGGLRQLGCDLLDRKIELGRQVLALADKLFPAETRVRGLVMFELHEALAEQMRRKASEGTLKPPQLKTDMKECKKMLLGADRLLSSEPEELPEGEVAVEAKRRILDLQQCARNGDGDDQPSSLAALQATINPCPAGQPTEQRACNGDGDARQSLLDLL
ncbi:SET domain-containing protein SmydA-8-like [Bacillus rossius redtenbacheri]|uniref:SET domain-containing protein SmydA-8-like n=1 Tax=Bacillus rossius redtenbacheri TaxID=93214 RepID=UPI002FDD0920